MDVDEFKAVFKRASGEAASRGENVTFTQCRLAWDTARKQAQADLRDLETSILAVTGKIPGLGQGPAQAIAQGAKRIYTILEKLDDRLLDKLDELLIAPTPQAKLTLREQAVQIVKEYRVFVDTDSLLTAIDEYPMRNMNVHRDLSQILGDLEHQLS